MAKNPEIIGAPIDRVRVVILPNGGKVFYPPNGDFGVPALGPVDPELRRTEERGLADYMAQRWVDLDPDRGIY